MRKSLWLKLTGSFAVTVLLTSLSLIVLVRQITEDRYRSMVLDSDRAQAEVLAPQFADWFVRNGGWDGVQRIVKETNAGASMMNDREWSMMGSSRMRWNMWNEGMNESWGRGAMDWQGMSVAPRIVLADVEGRIIADSQSAFLDGRIDFRNKNATYVTISTEGRMVGAILVGSMIEPTLNQADRKFLASVNTAMMVVALVAVILSIITGSLLFRHIVAPLQHLADASGRIAAGNLETRVNLTQTDEIGELAGRFNDMAAALLESRQREQRFIADAAHELRTPVALIQGTLEMMMEGIYPADIRHLEELHSEAQRLGRLVADMQDLSRADAGRMELSLALVQVGSLLDEAASLFRPIASKQSVLLLIEGSALLAVLSVDKDRMIRVLTNLFANALRHTAEGGKITVLANIRGDSSDVEICVQDEGEGIPPGDAQKVFDRFYRSDESRNRDSGGSGLGLSICREIVLAHKGRIWVDIEYRAGARLCLRIPSNF